MIPLLPDELGEVAQRLGLYDKDAILVDHFRSAFCRGCRLLQRPHDGTAQHLCR